MEINTWLLKNRMTKTELAKRLNMQRSYVCAICNGIVPGKQTAIAIEILTNGEVSRYVLRPSLKTEGLKKKVRLKKRRKLL